MKRTLLTLMLAALAMPAVRAQSGAQDDNEGPGRGVARLSLMNGDVSVRRGDSGDWVAAVINAPLMAEDHVLTGSGSRSEVQFDYYHRLRLADDSEVRFSELEYRKYQIQVARGTVTFSALKGGDAQVELSTPGAAIRPLAAGQYRVTVRSDGAVEITVRDGEAEIYTPSGSEKLRPGKTMVVRLTGQGSQFQFIAAIPRDRWDDFNSQRDRELSRSNVYRYVSRDIYGAEDLDGHGEWVYAAPYGYVWAPRVAIGWAPYRYGRWSWLDWYGWSWVSYDPWGWAPYHYGRWFHHGGRWCWWPGVGVGFGYRHYWSPGFVAWFGFGSPGFGFGVGFGYGYGNWGWVPLAPYEPYHRWYGHRYYRGYHNHTTVVNNIRVVNNTNIYNNYRNARVSNGVSVLEGGDFTRGATGRAWRGSDGEFTRASLMQGPLPATPGRSNLSFTDRAVRSDVAARSTASNERFYSRSTAARVDRIPFEQQRQSLERVVRAPEARAADNRGAGAEGRRTLEATGDGPRGAAARGGTPAARTDEQGGWRRAEQPARSTSPQDSGRTYGTGDSWRRFGEPRTADLTQESSRVGQGNETSSPRNETPARQGETQDRGGWRTFGDPNRSSRSADSVVRESTRSEGSRSAWSTGGGRTETPRQEAPRTESPRSEGSRSGWSTGGGRTETPRQDVARPERSAPPRIERSEPSGRTAEPQPQRQESAPARRGSNDMSSSFSRGGWSTGGGTSSAMYGSTSSHGRSGADAGSVSSSRSGRGSWSTGGGRSAEGSYSTPSYGGYSRGDSGSTPSYGAGRGNWSTGSGRSSQGSYSPPSYGRYSGGDSGMRSQPQMSSPRSGGFGAPTYGGGFGGGSARSAPSSSGGSFGGGGRMSSGGGGMSSGGGGRMSGGGGGRGR